MLSSVAPLYCQMLSSVALLQLGSSDGCRRRILQRAPARGAAGPGRGGHLDRGPGLAAPCLEPAGRVAARTPSARRAWPRATSLRCPSTAVPRAPSLRCTSTAAPRPAPPTAPGRCLCSSKAAFLRLRRHGRHGPPQTISLYIYVHIYMYIFCWLGAQQMLNTKKVETKR